MKWNRGQTSLKFDKKLVEFSDPVMSVSETEDGRLLITTIFDESTPKDRPNVFIFDRNGKMMKKVRIMEDGRLVRFLGSETIDGKVYLLACNEMKYELDPESLDPIGKHYYR